MSGRLRACSADVVDKNVWWVIMTQVDFRHFDSWAKHEFMSYKLQTVKTLFSLVESKLFGVLSHSHWKKKVSARGNI